MPVTKPDYFRLVFTVKIVMIYSFVFLALPVFTIIPTNKTADVANGVTIECSAETRAGDKAAITWYKDGKVMSSSIRYHIHRTTGYLHIVRALVDDTGSYTCEASNAAGKIRATMYLIVEQKKIGKYVFEMHSL